MPGQEDSKPSFTEAFWKAEKIAKLDLPERWLSVGTTYNHRVPKPYDPTLRFGDFDSLRASIVETRHSTTVYLYTVIDPRLLRIYLFDNLIGGCADTQWAWRPGLFWTFCEECKTLFWAHVEHQHLGIFPPGFAVASVVQSYVDTTER